MPMVMCSPISVPSLKIRLYHHLLRNTQVSRDALVALILSRVTTHAIVDEGTRPILQGSLVGNINVGLVQRHAWASCHCKTWQQRKHQSNQLFFHQPVTLSGTGL